MFRSQKNTPGPVRESTWPAITAAPVAPGLGLLVYQPVTVVLAGTWRVPSRLSPSVVIGALTPMDGMVSSTGFGTGRAAACQVWVTAWPVGAATGDGWLGSRAADAGEPLATTRPAAPAPAARTPRPIAGAQT